MFGLNFFPVLDIVVHNVLGEFLVLLMELGDERVSLLVCLVEVVSMKGLGQQQIIMVLL